MTLAPTVQMNDGYRIPSVGCGTGMVQSVDVAQMVPEAISIGYRHIDTASSYNNEEAVGRALKSCDVQRSDLFITTKVPGEGHGYDQAQRSLDESLEKLDLEYVDLYLIHWPLPKVDKYLDTWRALVKLQKDGKVRSIGVSNFLAHHIDRLVEEVGVVPAVNQVQLYPGLSRNNLRMHHDELGVVTACWSPLSLGATTLYFGGKGEAIESKVVNQLADKYDRTAAQIILRWHTQLGMVPVSRSSKSNRLAQNIDTFDFELQPHELDEITSLDDGSQIPEDAETHGNQVSTQATGRSIKV